MKTIDIVLPVYDEEEGIAAFNSALYAAIEPLVSHYQFHIIYVVDRCRDNTFAVLKKLAAQYNNITLLHLSRRFGHQMSLVAGIDHSRGDALIMMDCDLQHPPGLIAEMLAQFEQGYEIVNAVRKYHSGAGWLKPRMSAWFYSAQNALSPVHLQEGAADFRLISRKVAQIFQSSVREQNQFLRGLFQWIGFRSTNVTFSSNARAAGATKYDFGRLLAFGVTGILSFSKLPLRLASLLGLLISTTMFFYGSALVLFYFFGGYAPRGYTSMIVAMLFLGGVQLLVLGILGEYLGTIFDEVKGRPLYVVDEIVQEGTP
jgi:glycosyltransferase involved in cell wall biosynthesis